MPLKKFFFECNIKLLEITINNCHKCALETLNDPNNSQYFWINRRNLEIETKRSWLFSKGVKTHRHNNIGKN